MTRKEEKNARGREAARLSSGLFRRGIIVGSHVDEARRAELGPRAKIDQDVENNKGWGGHIKRGAIRGRGQQAQRGKK